MARGGTRKYVVSARIKSPNESPGFCSHVCTAIKRTLVNLIIVAVIFTVLYFTDGFWLLTNRITLTPAIRFTSNQELLFVDHIFEDEVNGPESFAFKDDVIYTSCADGRVYSLKPDNSTNVVYSRCDEPGSELDCGRPLGLEIDGNELLIADSYFGIFALNLETNSQRAILSTGPNSTYKFLNAIAVTPSHLYVTSSSSLFQRENFPAIGLQQDCSGSVLKIDKKSLEVSVLTKGLCFPNGITVDLADPSYLIVAETMTARLIRVDSQSGKWAVFSDGLPGFPDNIRPSDNKGYWLGFPSVRTEGISLDTVYERPFVRAVLWLLHSAKMFNPVNLSPGYGLVVHVDVSGAVTRTLHDPSGAGSQKVSEAAQHAGFLYLGSYHPKYRWVSRYKLRKS